MPFSTLFLMAFRNVIRQRRRSVLAALAVFLGVAATTSMRGVLNGLQGAFVAEIVTGQVGAIQVHKAGWSKQVFSPPLTLDFDIDDAFLSKIRAVPNVKAVSPRIVFGGMVNANDHTVFSMLTAFDAVAEAQVCPLRQERITTGSIPGPAETKGVLAGEVARKLGVKPGDNVAILAADKDGSLNGLDAGVSGLNGLPGSPGLDGKAGLVPLAYAQELLRMPGRATELAISVKEFNDIEKTRAALAAALGPAYEVHGWQDIVPAFRDAAALQEMGLGVISSVLMLVALIGVVNVMLMAVLERTREIGTMMAVGLTRGRIVRLFLAEAAVLAVAAAIPGVVVAFGVIKLLGARGMSLMGAGGGILHLVPNLHPDQVIVSVSITIVGAIVAAGYPAAHAAALRPVEALSHP